MTDVAIFIGLTVMVSLPVLAIVMPVLRRLGWIEPLPPPPPPRVPSRFEEILGGIVRIIGLAIGWMVTATVLTALLWWFASGMLSLPPYILASALTAAIVVWVLSAVRK